MKRPATPRIVQILFLALFLVMFLMTEYRGSDQIGAAVNAFFRIDPLASLSALLASRSFTLLILPGLLLFALSFLFGRFFCGWICPLGTLLDLVTKRIKKRGAIPFIGGRVKYWLLLPILAAALTGVNLSGVLDPLAILVRGLTFFFHPLIGEGGRSAWVGLYRMMGERRDVLEPGYNLIKGWLLPFRETLYPLAFLSGAMLIGIFLLEMSESRAWCRRLCPLGTLLGIAGQFSLFRRVPVKLCNDCGRCRELCPTSFDHGSLKDDECIFCMQCVEGCPSSRVRFRPGRALSSAPVMERRVFLGGILSGLALSRSFHFRSPEAQAKLLRPPGVTDEGAFLAQCVRCGECMKVCLRSALYPSFLEAGGEGIYTPRLVPRLGYCEYNCTLCGQVCPTGAIPNLPVEQKRRAVIGKAVLDKNRCIPFARRTDCIVCEEHCPIPQKAIRSEIVEMVGFDGKKVKIKQPYVVEEICNGCGICENVCPLEGKAGIEVGAVKDRTPISEGKPSGSSSGSSSENPYPP